MNSIVCGMRGGLGNKSWNYRHNSTVLVTTTNQQRSVSRNVLSLQSFALSGVTVWCLLQHKLMSVTIIVTVAFSCVFKTLQYSALDRHPLLLIVSNYRTNLTNCWCINNMNKSWWRWIINIRPSWNKREQIPWHFVFFLLIGELQVKQTFCKQSATTVHTA